MMTIPGMEIAASAAGHVNLRIQRTGTNVWWLAFGASSRDVPAADPPHGALPAEVLVSLRDPTDLTLAKVELDACGAWITVANAAAPRPILARRAGWVDVRGHPYDGGPARGNDRAGLGPGDALVLACPADNDSTTDSFLDCVLNAAPSPAAWRDAALDACGGDDAAVVVLAVPGDLGSDARQRVADATGIAVDDLELPGYPLGDLQPELWHEPPRPPRLARLRLRPDAGSARDVRGLLERLIASWRLTGRVDQDALKLAASELATNALLHAGEPETATVRFFGHGVRIEVDDRSPATPTVRAPAPSELGGRGLQVVDAVASSWGVEPRPTGKRVWCEIDVAVD